MTVGSMWMQNHDGSTPLAVPTRSRKAGMPAAQTHRAALFLIGVVVR